MRRVSTNENERNGWIARTRHMSVDDMGGTVSNHIEYKYNEFQLIGELEDYVNSTYTEHYSKNKFQATEFIIDGGHGEGFALGNILKYTQRYGRKEGKNRKDLLKVLHYALIALHVHDLENEKTR
jgi:spore coat protein CotH